MLYILTDIFDVILMTKIIFYQIFQYSRKCVCVCRTHIRSPLHSL